MENIIGIKFNRLTVISFDHSGKNGEKYFRCLCECGNPCTVSYQHIKSGHTKSCGCYAKETSLNNGLRKTHGLIHTRLYSIWAGMKTRCLNPNSDHKKSYYDRGISVCEQWRDSFLSFYDWSIKNGYSDELTLDRIDGSSGYSPDNCRWATHTQQSRNRRNTIYIKLNGEVKTLKEWADAFKIPYITAYYRYSHGWTAEKILSI